MIIGGEKEDSLGHNKQLTEFLEVKIQQNLKLNYDKFHYKLKQFCFFRTTFTTSGHKPEDKKLQAISKMHQPIHFRTQNIS